MTYWILEWRTLNVYDGTDCNSTIWASEKDAQEQACIEIQDDISSNWDLQDREIYDIASSIFDAINAFDYNRAIAEYNMYQDDQDYPDYYKIYAREVEAPPALSLMALGPFESDDDEEEDDIPITMPGTAMTSSGATCRGTCGTYNEYAYPDNPNGTYCCYACKQSGSS